MIKSEADDLPPPPKLSTSALDAKNVSKVSKQSTSTSTTTSSATAAAASITKRRPRTSHIWNYSTINPEEGITLNHDGQEVWVCSMCKDKKTTYLLSGGTAAPIKHLLRVHKIEPCISAHSRPRRHGKHNSESSITLSSSTNASLYKNELHAQQYIVAPPPLLQQQLMPLLPPHLLAQHQALDLEDQFVFPMTAAATAYSLPATPITSEFMPSPFVFPMPQQQPQMAMSAATTAAYPMMAGSDCGSSSNNSTVDTPIMSSDESASSSPSSTTLKTAATTPASPGFSSSNIPTDPEMLVPTQHPEVNVDGAIKSLLEMVIQYDIPASLIESPSFKNFCISLNPNAVSALPSLKSTLSTSTFPSSTTATTTSTANTTTSSSPTSSTPTNTCSTVVTPMFTNYTYTSSNSQSGCPPNAYAAQMQWVVPQLDVMSSGLVIQPESLVSDQQFQNDYLW